MHYQSIMAVNNARVWTSITMASNLNCYERRGFTRMSYDELPPKEAFYCKLNECDISEVWSAFECMTFRDYHNLNMSDILLLADIFENLRSVYLQIYKLDPAWYTSPGLIWDAMLKMTKIELEWLSDYDVLLIIKKGIRGGISIISNRYGKASATDTWVKRSIAKNLLHALPTSMQTTFTVAQCHKKLLTRGF